jgi:hypothetical protein
LPDLEEKDDEAEAAAPKDKPASGKDAEVVSLDSFRK